MLGKSLLTNLKKKSDMFSDLFYKVLTKHDVKQEPSENDGNSNISRPE